MKKNVLILFLMFCILFLFSCNKNNGLNQTTENQTITTDENGVEDLFYDEENEKTVNIDKNAKVYYLNFKPELENKWKELAELYTMETGIQVEIETYGEGQYESMLEQKMNLEKQPTLFQVTGAKNLSRWKHICLDLKNTSIYKNLIYENLALKMDDEVKAIPYAIECYGIIVNKNLLSQAGYSVLDIKNFESFQQIVEDISSRQEELGFTAFTSCGMDKSSDWRFKTHLANLPIYYEYKKDKIVNTEQIKGTYLDNFKMIWELYVNNSTVEPEDIESCTIDDARSEFINGKAVFYQNGSWEYPFLSDFGFTDDELQMIPIYIGVDSEFNQGLCTGTENYWCVNKNSEDIDIEATINFLNWCITNPTGIDMMMHDMNLNIPFKNVDKNTNLFINQNQNYINNGKVPVRWDFTTIPSENWKDELAKGLVEYAKNQDPTVWNDSVKNSFINNWHNNE